MADIKKESMSEEASALGQRVKGAAKNAAGAVTGNESLEREGEMENVEGRARQGANEVLGLTAPPRSPRGQSGYVTGLYRTPEDATRAYEGLTTKHGYEAKDVDVLMSDETRTRYFGDVAPGQELKTGTKAAEGLGKGRRYRGWSRSRACSRVRRRRVCSHPGIGNRRRGSDRRSAGRRRSGCCDRRPHRSADRRRDSRRKGSGVRARNQRRWNRIGTRARDEKQAGDLERDFGSYGGTSILR